MIWETIVLDLRRWFVDDLSSQETIEIDIPLDKFKYVELSFHVKPIDFKLFRNLECIVVVANGDFIRGLSKDARLKRFYGLRAYPRQIRQSEIVLLVTDAEGHCMPFVVDRRRDHSFIEAGTNVFDRSDYALQTTAAARALNELANRFSLKYLFAGEDLPDYRRRYNI